MEVMKAVKERRSIRKYSAEEVKREKIEKLLDAARWAPSSKNSQPWEFIVIKSEETKERIANNAKYEDFITEAPVVIAFVTDPSRSHLHKIDGALATQNFQLAAWALGLGTCWIGTMNREKVKKLLNIPQKKHLLTVLPVGHPAEEGHSTRRQLEEITYGEKFGKKWL